MALKKKLPVGVEFFNDLIRQDFYYVDKTGLIIDLVNNQAKVNLFTRPRRFGKSLNMRMLQTFFEVGCDPSLFDGLKVSQDSELCKKYMGQFPVISITLKNVEGLSFEAAKKSLKDTIATEARRFYFLLKSDRLEESDRKSYETLISISENGEYDMPDTVLEKSLLRLSILLSRHYGKQVILLIDEYDVPLDKAFQYGYYDEMVSLIRNLFGNALKTNPDLYFAVLTGCLRIAKESIFTGLNNFCVMSILDKEFDEYFGFTDSEVKEMLSYYDLSDHFDSVKEWYDGYQFGSREIYCPWDVINYCKKLCADPDAWPEDYWSNSSGNAIVRRFIDMADAQTRSEIEQLIVGETITKEIRQELTYNELDTTIENLWSVLFTTGYLTQRGRIDGKKYRLAIPNRELRELFVSQIREWFKESVGKDRKSLDNFCEAFLQKDTTTIQDLFGDYLWNTISIRDTATAYKENFYHGILLGLFGYMRDWIIKSNIESGIGYSDILIEAPRNRTGIIIELKYAEDGNMDAACQKALAQIEEKQYAALLKEDGMRNIIKYGIACYKKDCQVVAG
ncbi:AAA family ATPase [Blautia sp. HCP28S3_G10]|uniref:AAA family ATPase n=1 Tax=Blautia sp. HCP28S3_G10 TaxID=3438908 RepID=UPI003F89C174